MDAERVSGGEGMSEPGTMEYWRDAYWKLANGGPVEVRLCHGNLDEVVGSGAFHVEQLGKNSWFFDLGGCRFRVVGKKLKLLPIEVDTWSEEKDRQDHK